MRPPDRSRRSLSAPRERGAEAEGGRGPATSRPPDDQQAGLGLPDEARTTYHEILDNVADGVYFVDRERRITYWNRAATEISGHARENVVGHRCPQGPLQHVDMEGRRLCQTACPLSYVLADGQPRQADVLLRHRDGHRVPVRVSVRPIRSQTGEVTGAVETFTDITPLLAVERRAAELERLAFIDTLTGLGNRQFGERQLESALSELDRHGRVFGLLLLDIDHFKNVNDTWGHETGDAVLRAVGRTLSGAARTEDFTARWGGEEFLVLVRESEIPGLGSAAERIRRMVAAASVNLPGAEIAVTVSIGGTIARPGETETQLLRRADLLLYRSKEHGRNRVTVGP
jgi:diguanylate cyclase (GGDEF)-like protein/PAS domain S-box-containing protein